MVGTETTRILIEWRHNNHSADSHLSPVIFFQSWTFDLLLPYRMGFCMNLRASELNVFVSFFVLFCRAERALFLVYLFETDSWVCHETICLGRTAIWNGYHVFCDLSVWFSLLLSTNCTWVSLEGLEGEIPARHTARSADHRLN